MSLASWICLLCKFIHVLLIKIVPSKYIFIVVCFTLCCKTYTFRLGDRSKTPKIILHSYKNKWSASMQVFLIHFENPKHAINTMKIKKKYIKSYEERKENEKEKQRTHAKIKRNFLSKMSDTHKNRNKRKYNKMNVLVFLLHVMLWLT